MAQAPRDDNFVPATLFVGSDGETYAWEGDEATGRAYVDLPGGSGTVTSVSVVTANGFAGSVANATTTPAITLSTTVSGVLKGNGTAISAASAGTDYVAPGAITTSGLTMATARILGRTTGSSGAVEEISVGTGLTLSAGQLTATGVASSIVVGTTTITSGTTTRILYDNAGVLGEYTLTGSGTAVAMQTAPTFATSITTPSVLATANDSGALGASGTAFSDLFLASGGVINWNAGNATITHSAGLLTTNVPVTITGVATADGFAPTSSTATGNRMYLPAANTLGFAINGTGEVQLTASALSPVANDGNALGTTSLQWSDLFLASGAVIDFANGNVVMTHSSGILTMGTGEMRITTPGTNSASVVTVGGTQTLTSKTLSSPSITGTALLAEGAGIGLDPSLSADGTWSGITMTATAGYTQAFGDLVYLSVTDSRWEAADADAASTAGPVALGMVVVAGTDGNSCTILLQGVIRADAKFPTMTVGATQYVGETAGAIQETIPTGSDNVIRTVGYALTADALYFNPSTDWQITVA